MTYAFDTLDYAKRLREAGVEAIKPKPMRRRPGISS